MKFTLSLTFLILFTVFFANGQDESENPPAPPAAASETTASPDSTIPTQGAPAPAAPGGEDKKLDFIERSHFVLAKLLKNNRAIDPFGQQMDPANTKEAPMLAQHYDDIEETPALNNSSLKSALLTLPITGVYPQRNVIVIGARSFTPGGQFGMKLQDLTIRLRFEGVRGKEIFFKDMETQEVTSVEYNSRPQEFEPLTNAGPQPLGSGIVSMTELYIAN